jgi:hypothetical protein
LMKIPYGVFMMKKMKKMNRTYQAALLLVTRLDTHLWYGTAHFYTRSGHAIRHLDEAVNAILSDDFAGTVPPQRDGGGLQSVAAVVTNE